MSHMSTYSEIIELDDENDLRLMKYYYLALNTRRKKAK